jgi:hypothetical protein
VDQDINELFLTGKDHGMTSSVAALVGRAPSKAWIRHLQLNQITYVRL